MTPSALPDPGLVDALLTFSQLAGVWRATSPTERIEIARMSPALGATLDVVAGVDPTRCPLCDHLSSVHSDEGCWWEIPVQVGDERGNCPCEHSGEVRYPVAAGDLALVANAVHVVTCCPRVHRRANQEDEDVAVAVLAALAQAGRLVVPTDEVVAGG